MSRWLAPHYAKDVEHILVHRAGLLTSGYKRFPSRLPIHSLKMYFRVQDSGFCSGYLSLAEIPEGTGRLPVTVARLCRNCTDFPILPEYRFRPPDGISNVLLPASSIRRVRRLCQLISDLWVGVIFCVGPHLCIELDWPSVQLTRQVARMILQNRHSCRGK